MELIHTALEVARNAFIDRYPDFKDFTNEAYQDNERKYKNELIELFQERIRPAIDRNDDTSLGEEALSLLTEPLKITKMPQNIVDWRSFPPANKLSDHHKRDFGRAIRSLFDTNLSLDNRLKTTNEKIKALYSDLNINFTSGISRLLLSFYLSLDDPSSYWFIKTRKVKHALQALAPTIQLSKTALTEQDVRNLQDFARSVFYNLEEWGWDPKDLIDVQGFIWTAFSQPERRVFDTHAVNIRSEHVNMALKEIDKNGIPSDAQSSTYDLIYGSGRYPPKLVLSIASKYANGEELDRSQFIGGEKSQAFELLRNLGFHIERKDLVTSLVTRFIAQANEASDLSTSIYPKSYRGLRISVSFGQGNFAKVPWISFTGHGQTTQRGIYPVFLYYKSINVLILSYGVSETNTAEMEWPESLRQNTIANYLSEQFSHKPERYGNSFVASVYLLNSEINTHQITEDLDKAIAKFDAIFNEHEPSTLSTNKATINNDMSNSLNLIYYGPPGTGKTYKTIAKAVKICDGKIPEERDILVKRFKELQEKQRISFVTFHQSYSYEDFVEGIRPTLAGDAQHDEFEGHSGITYECRPGVFRTICELAKQPHKDKSKIYDFDIDKVDFWKMSLGDTSLESEAYIYEQCIEKGQILLGYGHNLDFSGCDDKDAIISKLREVKPDITPTDYNVTSINYFKNIVKIGDIVIISDGNRKFRAIGKITGEYQYSKDDDYTQKRPVEWLIIYEESQTYEKILRNKFSQMTLYHLSKKVLRLESLKELLTAREADHPQNFVLIIDEINRGNIAKIFGELISLIDMDKRIGAKNELSAVLPYSGESFGVPNNLYVLGTMNTSDRSIALLDTALRRRFIFKELMPQENLILGQSGDGLIPDDEGGIIDLRALLRVINQRIQFMLNRDQMVGHAYFMNIVSFNDLRRVFCQQIIPLLQEYFYEDWHKLQVVLCDIKNDNTRNEPQLIQNKVIELNTLGFVDDDYDYQDSVEYHIVQENEIKPEAIRKIYEN